MCQNLTILAKIAQNLQKKCPNFHIYYQQLDKNKVVRKEKKDE